MGEAPQIRTPDTQLFRDVFNSSPIGIVVETLDGQPLFVNPAFCSMLGFTEDELRSKHCVDFSPPEDAEKDWALFQQLRAGSIDRYQLEKRYFRRDGSVVWGRLSLSLLMSRPSPLVIAMVEDITDKRRAEEALRDSEERLRLAQQAARVGAFEWNIQTGVDTWTPELEAMHGLPPGGFAGTQTAWENLLHPDDRARVLQMVDEALKTGEANRGEWRVIWPDGSVHWIVGRWQVLMDESGEPSRMVGVNIDVTARKRAEEALSGMSRKLLESQEQERARIGRELHDDINQRLAMLAVELEQLQDDPSELQSRLEKLRKDATEISNDVQALSHELHSSKLEYLGAVAGIKSWCKEFAERQKIQIDFRSDVISPLPLEIGLSVFRVLQEALHNALKHSGVKRVEVELSEHSDDIHLTIRDSGKGFEILAARRGSGLGLTSMEERVRLVNGTIAIESKPMAGTTIRIRVPFKQEPTAQRPTG
jgi:PAS domain S-box-containing protein